MTRYKEEFSTYNAETNQVSANGCNAITFVNQSTGGEICKIENLLLPPSGSYSSNFNEGEINLTTYNVSWVNNQIGILIIIKKVLA